MKRRKPTPEEIESGRCFAYFKCGHDRVAAVIETGSGRVGIRVRRSSVFAHGIAFDEAVRLCAEALAAEGLENQGELGS